MALMDDLRLDIRFAFRNLRRHAALSVTIVATLALGVGATSAMFSVINPVLLRPLPYRDADHLMMALSIFADRQQPFAVFGPDYEDWRAQCDVCSDMGAFAGAWPSNLSAGGDPERIRIARVTSSVFTTLGVAPKLGRTFLPDETGRAFLGATGTSSANSAIVLGHDLWTARFGSDPSVLGRRVVIDGDPCTIVGIMPPGFSFPHGAEAWLPATINPRRDNAFLQVVVRLAPGISQAQAQTTFSTIAQRLARAYPDTNERLGVSIVPLHEYIAGKIRPSLVVLFGAVGLVLLIACANVANLLLAQASRRPLEMAVRSALGASRSRLTRQLLTESLLLALFGAGAGLLLTTWIVPMVAAAMPTEIPRVNAIEVDRWAVAFTVALAAVTGLVFGLAPVVYVSRGDLAMPLKSGMSSSTRPPQGRRMQRALVAAEYSLALVLLIGAGLLMKSFVRLRETPLGFDASRVLTATVSLPESTYPSAETVREYFSRAMPELQQQHDAQAVGIVNALPLGLNGARIRGDFTVDGEASPRPRVWASKVVVGGDYFRALGIPLQRGRVFDARDAEHAPASVIISESLARQLWPDRDPIGRRLNVGFPGEGWGEVVGVVGDVRQEELNAAPSRAIYQPYSQVARRWALGDMTFVVRTTEPTADFVRSLRTSLYRVDNTLPVYDVMTMNEIVAARTTDPRFYALLLGSFSAVALALAVAGLYGLASYFVTQRTSEIGIRMALGARTTQIVRLVGGEALALVAVGGAVGLIGAALLTRVLTRFLYQVTATDPLTFVTLPLLLLAAALAACYFPARRATKVDPLVALRCE